jgi:hypothetical protein
MNPLAHRTHARAMCTAPGTIDAIAPFSAFREAVSFTLMNPMRAAELGPETPSSLPDDTWLRVIPRALGYTGSQTGQRTNLVEHAAQRIRRGVVTDVHILQRLGGV